MGLQLAVFDVNETLVDMAPLEHQFLRAGLTAAQMRTWFAATLRDGFALTILGEFRPFRALAVDNLLSMLRAAGVADGAARATEIVDGISDLPLHADVAPGLRSLWTAGTRIATMTNGSRGITESVLARQGLLDVVERCLDVSSAQHWKPAPEAYRHVLTVMDVAASEAALVAVHPWDVHGARRAGLRGVWLDRGDVAWPQSLPPPDHRIEDIGELAGLMNTHRHEGKSPIG